jgi:SAM-dependent methyltransferase
LYTSRLPDSTTHERYAGYYDVDNLSVPEFLLKRIAEIVAGFSRYRKTNRLLEVGFGAATTLEAARKANWETSGIEVSSRAIEHARQLGFDVFEGELQKAKYPAAHFDVVVASEILEHVPDPSLLAEEIRRVLRPGGMLWATTPNVHSLLGRLLKQNWSAVCPPEHLQLFSRAGIAKMLRSAGFRSIWTCTEGLNPYELRQALPGRQSSSSDSGAPGGCERVRTGYELNEALMQSPLRRSIKTTANVVLRATGLGDSLKIWAETKEEGIA